jgi:hypothetical protein
LLPGCADQGFSVLECHPKDKMVFQAGSKAQCRRRETHVLLAKLVDREGPLRDIFPRLFQCCDNPFAIVAGVRDANGWRIHFRRNFGLAEMVEWDNLCRIFDLHPYTTGEDEVNGPWRPRENSLPGPSMVANARGGSNTLQGGLEDEGSA